MNNETIFSLALDGPCGAGKSSVAKSVAKITGAAYLDTGAMYRSVGLYMLENGVSLDDAEAIAAHVGDTNVTISYMGGSQQTYLNGRDVTTAIRQPEVSAAASAVAKVPAVRERMVQMQRAIARGIALVMDGRDIGTCVLPDATLKVYLTATPEERARRRYEQAGRTQPYEDVLREIIERDHNDTTRAVSPLRRADDAVEVDSTNLTEEEVVNTIVTLLRQRMEGKV